jgi:hypothetical protein
MKLLDEWIDLLSDQEGSLTDALLATKVEGCWQIARRVAGRLLAGGISAHYF